MTLEEGEEEARQIKGAKGRTFISAEGGPREAGGDGAKLGLIPQFDAHRRLKFCKSYFIPTPELSARWLIWLPRRMARSCSSLSGKVRKSFVLSLPSYSFRLKRSLWAFFFITFI